MSSVTKTIQNNQDKNKEYKKVSRATKLLTPQGFSHMRLSKYPSADSVPNNLHLLLLYCSALPQIPSPCILYTT